MTILVAAQIDLQPEQRAAALAGAKDLIQMALAEPGCRHYSWSADPHDPGRVNVFEQWDSAQDLQDHFTAPSYTGMLTHLSEHGLIGAVATKYRCDLSEPVYGPDGNATATFVTEKN